MSLEITKICRTCLALEGALLSIYDSKGTSGSNGCVADMLGELTSNPPKQSDGMPEKVCIACISEINRCYSFKMRCDNSDKTLRQLLKIATDDEETPKVQQEVVLLPKVEFPDVKKPQKRKADMSIRIIREETKQEVPIEENEVYSLQAEEELEASYFVIGSVEDENEGEEEQQESQGDGNSDTYEEELLQKFVKQSDENDDEAVIEEIDNSEEYKPSGERVSKRKKEELKCSSCPMAFVHPRNLAKHMSKYHNTQDLVQPYTQPERPELKDPVKKKEPEVEEANEEQEDFEIEFQTIEEAEETTIVDEPDNPKLEKIQMHTHRCPYCGAGFAQQISLNIHIKQSKCTEKQYSCFKCQKVFISKESLHAHIQNHKKQFTCEVCNDSFAEKEQLNEHEAEKHYSKAKNKCTICKKVFSMLSTLKDHMRIHSGEKPFLCSLCGKGFSQNANLKQHVMRHNKQKPFKCDQCSWSFVSKGELYSHLRSHTGDHPFVCDICKSAFTTSSTLVKHKRIHTGERPYGCEFCPMRFTALNTLKNHRRTHTGEKPYKCKFCQRGFAQRSDCTIHMRTHTGERRYICQICGSAFQQSGTLRTHMKTHKRKDEVLTVTDDDSELEEAQSQEQAYEKKSPTSMEVTVDLGEDDLLNFAIEECSSEHQDFNGEYATDQRAETSSS